MRSLAIVLTLGLPTALRAEDTTTPVARGMTEAAQKFLRLLDPDQRSITLLPFDDPRRVDWHNIPKAQRKGLQLRAMNAEQRDACLEVVRSSLSPAGYEKALLIMALENNLREGEKSLIGGPLRDPDRYFLTLFGEPSMEGKWGWSFEGHHFSLNFVVKEGAVLSDTPSFWGANPATVHVFVPGGPKVDTRTLAEEEKTAFALMTSLTDSQRAKATIAAAAPPDYRAAGLAQPPSDPPQGISAKELDEKQMAMLTEVYRAYCSNLAEPLAEKRLAAIKNAGVENIHFAWAGPAEEGKPHYFAVQGPTFILELVNVQSDPQGNPANHIHSVWRDARGDFALPIQ